MAWYRTGTAAVTNGSTAVVGTTTGWSSQVKAGDGITFDAGATWYEVASVTDNTHLTLASSYAGSTASGLAYACDRRSPLWQEIGDVAVRVAQLLDDFDASAGAFLEKDQNLADLVDVAAARTALGLGALAIASSVTASQISNASANGRSLITAADYAAMKALLAISTGDVDGLAAALAAKAPLASPALSGTPTAPTAAGGTNTTQIATTAFVKAAVDALVAAAPGVLDTLDELAAALGDDPNFAATMVTALAGKQPLDNELTAIAALTSAADQLPYFTGSGTAALTALTAFARTLLAGASAAATQAALGVREVLTSARTYYVRTDGNDSNTGTANTSGGAFLTIQKAVDTIATLDINGQAVTVQVGDGTYTGSVTLKNVVGFAAPGNLVIQGNNGTPANVIVSTAGSAFSASRLYAVWDIKDLKIQTSAAHGIIAQRAGVRFSNLVFGAISGTALWCGTQGNIVATGNYSFGGNSGAHVHVETGSSVVLTSRTITCLANSAIGVFAEADHVGDIEAIGATISLGAFSVTGQRYLSSRNANIYTGGAGANFFPGDVAGATSSGGQYL